MKYARICDVTGEGMNEGWCWGDGLFYTKYYKDTITELRKDYPHKNGFMDDDLLTFAVDSDLLYYTEWEEEDAEYKLVKGKLVEL